LDLNFPIDDEKKNGVTALGIACIKGNIDIVKMLHRAGASLNSLSKRGICPLAHAIKNKHENCIRYLIDNNVDIPKSLI
jgi:ankyrin repeat protein